MVGKGMNMFRNLTAKLRKIVDVTSEDFMNLLRWESAGIDVTNPNLLVASATDENGAVAYTTIEPTWILSGYAFRPKLTDEVVGHAGDSMDNTIVREARAKGVGRVLIVLPPNVPTQPDEQTLRVVERKITVQQYEQVLLPDLRVTDSPSAWIN
jgi:hypothetical protein